MKKLLVKRYSPPCDYFFLHSTLKKLILIPIVSRVNFTSSQEEVPKKRCQGTAILTSQDPIFVVVKQIERNDSNHNIMVNVS